MHECTCFHQRMHKSTMLSIKKKHISPDLNYQIFYFINMITILIEKKVITVFNIARYTVRNVVLWRRASGAVKHDFRTYI